jgi:hypothetical protein
MVGFLTSEPCDGREVRERNGEVVEVRQLPL